MPAAGAQTPAAPTAPTAGNGVIIWAGPTSFGMAQFNAELQSQGNSPITRGLDIAGEVKAAKLAIAKITPFITVTLPVGLEYFSGSSRTVHSTSTGGVTVNWQLPVVGVYTAPMVTFHLRGGPTGSKEPSKLKLDLLVRPVSLGYYTLGHVLDASLTVNDRPGELDAKGAALGVTTSVGLAIQGNDTAGLVIEAGYRKLDFGSVGLTTVGGFTFQPGTQSTVGMVQLPQLLSYSGYVFRVGVRIGV